MEFAIIIAVCITIIVVLKFVFEYNIKKLKIIGENPELDELTKNYPSNVEMCKAYLKKLKNEDVKIEENENNEASLYIAATNKIIIANIKNSYTRIQTIAHECLHSVQNKKLQKFNFVFSNIYLLFFLVICVLAIFKMLPNKMLFLEIFTILSFVFYLVRAYLENDAMIKARYLAKEYLEENKISTKEEIEKIVEGFDKINDAGIKCINFNLFLGAMVKIILFSIICILS